MHHVTRLSTCLLEADSSPPVMHPITAAASANLRMMLSGWEATQSWVSIEDRAKDTALWGAHAG